MFSMALNSLPSVKGERVGRWGKEGKGCGEGEGRCGREGDGRWGKGSRRVYVGVKARGKGKGKRKGTGRCEDWYGQLITAC